MRSLMMLGLLAVMACGEQDADGDGVVASVDCDDDDPAVHPGAAEVCNGADDDCDGTIDEDAPGASLWFLDADGDGFGDPEAPAWSCDAIDDHVDNDDDCDDSNAAAYPGASEVWYDGVDQACDGGNDHDQDGDGFPVGSDCNDTNATVSPGAVETWYDGTDQDCDGADDFDRDGDGFRDADEAVDGDDCDDGNAAINPGATDIVGDDTDQNCDGVDGTDADGDGVASEASGGEDCDDAEEDIPGSSDTYGNNIDENCDGVDGTDADGDGWASSESGGPDCDDGDSGVHPGAPDTVGDGDDLNCDDTDGVDFDGDGEASVGSGGTDCNDGSTAVHSGAVDCVGNAVDDNCDGIDGTDADGDLFAAAVTDAGDPCFGFSGDDCDDADPAVHPGRTDIVGDGADLNCDGMDGTDQDGDGFAAEYSGGSDCNDGHASAFPGASEVCDGILNDCEGDMLPEESDSDGDFYVECTVDGGGWNGDPSILGGDDCLPDDTNSFPGAVEQCDRQDNDCDEDVDEGLGCDFEWVWGGETYYGFYDWETVPIYASTEGWYEERVVAGPTLCQSPYEYIYWAPGPDVSTVTSCPNCIFTLKAYDAESYSLSGTCSFYGPTGFSDVSQRVPLAFDATYEWYYEIYYPYYLKYASGYVHYGLDNGAGGYDWYPFGYSYFYARAVYNYDDGGYVPYYYYNYYYWYGKFQFYGLGYVYTYYY
ncbi:MAG: hypothetical protein JRI25_19615 [Deltaproteobacteria bacterium]|nr:hypothetical protein [Deltaproteobacteria bacterium]